MEHMKSTRPPPPPAQTGDGAGPSSVAAELAAERAKNKKMKKELEFYKKLAMSKVMDPKGKGNAMKSSSDSEYMCMHVHIGGM